MPHVALIRPGRRRLRARPGSCGGRRGDAPTGGLVVLVGAVLALALVGCGDGSGPSSPSATGSAPTASALERAQAALLTDAETPPAPPGTDVEIGRAITAEGAAIAQPWTQFMVCPIVASRPDEGPATDVEPNATAAAWAFGVAGAAQLDQYAIVYADEAAAQAAVARAQAKFDDCATVYEENSDYFGDPPEVTLGEVPGSVDGFRVRGLFRSERESISTVMRVGDTVHYMRFSPAGYIDESGDEVPDPNGLLNPEWTEQVITAAADNLAG